MNKKKKPIYLPLPFVVMYGVCAALWVLLCVVDMANANKVEVWKIVCTAVFGVSFLALLVVYCIGRKKQ